MSRRGDSGHRYETCTYLDMGTSPGVCSGLKIVSRHGRHENDNILFAKYYQRRSADYQTDKPGCTGDIRCGRRGLIYYLLTIYIQVI